jgi:hypothetical protein
VTPSRPPLAARTVNAQKLDFPGFEITWAGEGPPDLGLCIGSEDGRIAFKKPAGNEWFGPFTIVESSEAINGVAFTANVMAVSTRSEVVVWNVPDARTDRKKLAEFEGGAHGVLATPSGRLVAPLGINGLLSTEGNFQGCHFSVRTAPGRVLDFYKVISLGTTGEAGVIACALRHHGLATIVCDEETKTTNVLTPTGLDIVDLCPLGISEAPFAAVALAIDASVHFIRDVRHDRHLETFRPEARMGSGYRILSAQGHLFLLTSDSLTILPDRASLFLRGGVPSRTPTVWSVPMRAVDAAVAFDRWLLVVMPDGSLDVHDVDALVSALADRVSGPTASAGPSWEPPAQRLEAEAGPLFDSRESEWEVSQMTFESVPVA